MLSSMAANLQKQLDTERRAVDTERFDITIREFVRLVTTRELHLAPAYQRKFRWDEVRESALIESLFLGLPVPPIFVATNADGRWEVVDGVQRITTLLHYTSSEEEQALQYVQEIRLTAPLKLNGLEKLTNFEGLAFAELPTPLKLHFYKRSLQVIALSDKSDEVVRYDLFERLNRGGISLTSQEVRACIFQGQFNDFLRRLAKKRAFNSLIKLKKAQENDGTKEEVVLKFFAYLHNREEFDKHVTKFLNQYMKTSSKDFDYEINERLFDDVTKQLAKVQNGEAILRKNTSVTPINLLEGVMVGAAEVIRRGQRLEISRSNWLDDGQLSWASTAGTNTPSRLEARITRAAELLSGANPSGRRPSNRK
jgi:hypothetical protein